MTELFHDLLINVIPSIVVGTTSILATVFTLRSERKKDEKHMENMNSIEQKNRFSDIKLQFYIELIDVLEKITVSLAYYQDLGKVGINVNEVENSLNDINNYLNSNRGKIRIFLPEKIYSDIVRLRGGLYSEIENPKFYDDIINIEETELFKLAIKAKEIELNLKKEIY